MARRKPDVMVSLSNHGSSRLELPTTILHDSDVVLSLAKHDRNAILAR